ncbi:MAG: flavoprotein [Glycomyces artemisiae]|uniref:Flavoprotein n=1 Tax=Glycomyces artemisiae TaxID=1076443 RepID=A0A850CBK4_9ACTN|nr:flavoprotein [Glycomyces artemisiae]
MKTLYIGVCGAGPASQVGELVKLAQADGWGCWIILSPAAVPMVDVQMLEAVSGHPVRSAHRAPGTPGRTPRPKADALIIAPASANTIAKLGAGIADTYLLDVATEMIGLGVPTVILPFVNLALAARRPVQRAVEDLRAEGVAVLLGEGGFVPHPPGTGGDRIDVFPWGAALAAVSQCYPE